MTTIDPRLAILRFVRDTCSSEHIYPSLAEHFGAAEVCDCLCWKWLRRQSWRDQPTQFIELTDKGEQVLSGE